jgi:LCP family protein required for cell wall assembly
MPPFRFWLNRSAPQGGCLRPIVRFLAVVGSFVVIVLIGIRLFAPTWWAVPGLLLGSVGQQVSRPGGSGDLTGTGVVSGGKGISNTLPQLPGGVSRVPGAAGPASQSGPASATPDLLESLSGNVVLPHRRFTILLLGSDNDKKFTANAVLTQSMILVSIDPTTRDVAMVSIPRDFWVPIPTYGEQKIDVAYEVGGIALARTTVEDLFNIHVDYYAWVGLGGLVQVIDSLGGVNVTVLHPILDETYPDDLTGPNPYAFFRLYLPAGPQHLDGTTALEYVRSRHGDLQSDFGRSARQQQVLLAIKDLATDPSVIGHIPDLAASLSDAVKTDLTLAQILQLASLARGISGGQIHQQVLAAPRFAQLGWSPDHQEQIVIPDWQAIRQEMARVLQLHPDGVTDAQADQARQEQATIRVLNGTGESNLAADVMDYLEWQGLSVLSVGNAQKSSYAHSEILIRDASKPTTSQVLALALNASIVSPPDPTLATDVVVIVGQDHPTLPVSLVAADASATAAANQNAGVASPTAGAQATLQAPPSPSPTRSSRAPSAGATDLVIVPSLIRMAEAVAQRTIADAGLMTSYINYQTAADVPDRAYFRSIPPGAVLSQSPAPGTRVPRGTKVILAVRKS